MRALLCAALLALLAACGGGSDDTAPHTGIASPPAPPCTPRVVTVSLRGDSTMFGMGNRVQVLMDAQFGAGAVIVTNYGVPGTHSYDAPDVVPADVVVANYGINDMRDGATTLAGFRMYLGLMDLTLVETQSPQAWDKGYYLDTFGANVPSYDEAGFVGVERTMGVPVADTYAYVKAIPNWESLTDDGVHPAAALYDMIAANVLGPAVAKQVAPLRCVAP